MIFELPKSVSVGGQEREIRWEYRDVLTILAAAADPDLSKEDKALVALAIFYPRASDLDPSELQEALERISWFIDGGQEPKEEHGPRLMDWEQDFPYIIASINRVMGREIRGPEPVHWWTFLSAYYEIGDCLFAQIVHIRDAKARGKKLDKAEREWARRHADLVQLKTRYSEAEMDFLSDWIKGGKEHADQQRGRDQRQGPAG